MKDWPESALIVLTDSGQFLCTDIPRVQQERCFLADGGG